MSGLLQRLRSARHLEWLLLAACACLVALALWPRSSGVEQAQATQLEARLERVLASVEGAGAVRAMITERDGEVLGVLVVAEGAADVGVRLELLRATRALLDVELSRIEVVEMGRDGHAQALDCHDMRAGGVGGGHGGGVVEPG